MPIDNNRSLEACSIGHDSVQEMNQNQDTSSDHKNNILHIVVPSFLIMASDQGRQKRTGYVQICFHVYGYERTKPETHRLCILHTDV